jgi:hypothetical protein
MQLDVDVFVKWRATALEMDAELGRFDFQTGVLTVAPNVPMTFWRMDSVGWEEFVRASGGLS